MQSEFGGGCGGLGGGHAPLTRLAVVPSGAVHAGTVAVYQLLIVLVGRTVGNIWKTFMLPTHDILAPPPHGEVPMGPELHVFPDPG